MASASFEVMGLSCRMNGTPISLQNNQDDGISHCTTEPLGTRVRTKVSTLERSEGEGTAVVVRHKPLYDSRNDSTMVVLCSASIWWDICGARERRSTGADFNSATTMMDQREGPLDVLKGRQQLPGLWTTGPRAELASESCM